MELPKEEGMRLSELKGTLLNVDAEITSVSFDSKNTDKAAYFCLVGTKDGHDFAKEAMQNGAVAIICERRLEIDLPQLIVEDARASLAEASAKLNGNPEKKLKIIGITGTNGKTTTSYILASIFAEYGAKAGIIGTNGAVYDGKHIDLRLTTPDPPQLFCILREMLDAGVEYVVMEVSAHALALNKTAGIVFDVAAFTNLTQDHLDYFSDMSAYAEAKARLFTPKMSKTAVINIDDAFGKALCESALINTVTYGCLSPADVFAIDLKMGVGGLEYVLNLMDDIAKIKFCMTGRFNMYNSLCAAAAASVLGIPIEAIAQGIKRLKRVEGRYNIINATSCSVIIDFAHTEDGLRNIISSIREYAPAKIITVFGCGGDRDRAKRPLMGAVTASLSDYCVITSDNPRSEPPSAIIADIIKGVAATGRHNYVAVPDRREAIKHALRMANEGDIILIAGKGAERYQDIMGVRHPYNDGEYVLKLIEEQNI